jgi:hypothetical protein
MDELTLRDKFAIAVLSGGLARDEVSDYELENWFGRNCSGVRREAIIAADAYMIADRMIVERNRRK